MLNIKYYDNDRSFHLTNGKISYVMNILRNEQLGHVYFGKSIQYMSSIIDCRTNLIVPLSPCVFDGDELFSLENTPREYPSYGKSDYRQPVYQVKNSDGNTISNLVYKSHKITDGKPKLAGLPATYVESDDEAKTLVVTVVDAYLKLEVELFYTIFRDFDAIARSVRFINHGDDLRLLCAQSMCMDFHDCDYEMMQLDGAWGRERHINRRKLSAGIQSVESSRGSSSAMHNPFVGMLKQTTTEDHGDIYGFNLIYSGNFRGSIEVNVFDQTRVNLGINPFDFEWLLEKEESFQTPEAIVVYSDKGINGMSQVFHKLYRSRLARGEWRDKPSPTYANNWEATYFDFTEQKIIDLAKQSKELGLEMLVLDDGWFGKRDNDKCSLGDWYTYDEKLPNGLDDLGRKINELGLIFGLWFEPEMVNMDSDLYRAHPDWIIRVEGQSICHGRNQHILDYSNPKVVDYIYEMIEKVLSSAPIGYVKWDMNRNMTEIGSAYLAKSRQKEVPHRYILGLYGLLERLTNKFPYILFESCASGGNRFDGGMLYYMPQTWTSDNTDAVERLSIQYGTSVVYPLRSMASYVSPSPNHQQGRSTSLKMRSDVAMFGTYGYGIDITKIDENVKKEMQSYIGTAKSNRDLIAYGDFYRLMSPFDSNFTAWLCIDGKKEKFVLGYYKVMSKANPELRKVKLVGLDESKNYMCVETGIKYSASQLINVGMFMPEEEMLDGDFISYLFNFKEV